MKKLLFFFVICFLLALNVGLSFAGNDSLVGEWLSEARTKGGLGTAITFKSDGTVVRSFGALLDLKYKLNKNVLSLYDKDGTQIDQSYITLSPSLLHIKNIKTGAEQTLDRIDGNDMNSILGKWSGPHSTGAKQMMHFTRAGICYFSVPMKSASKRFTLKENLYSEEDPVSGQNTEWLITIQNDLLTMVKKGSGEEKVYRRKM
jgi:hypothetical protein